MRILLVEDNAGDVFLVRRALQRHGLAEGLVVAQNGEIALQLLNQAAEDAPAKAPQLSR